MSYASLYGPMVDVLHNAFGVEFEFWDTGGGCTALVGELESDVTVYLTDSTESDHGRECMITSVPGRQHRSGTVGFAVGIYRDEHQTNVAYGDYPEATVEDLPVIIAEQLREARIYEQAQ